MDEPQPLGKGEYPNAGGLLAAAVGNCLCASFVYCMERARGDVRNLRADVETTLERNDNGRLRIKRISVKMFPSITNDSKFERCIELFEQYCIVTQSVKEGIDINVEIAPSPEGS